MNVSLRQAVRNVFVSTLYTSKWLAASALVAAPAFAAESSAPKDNELQEIIVTAQFREQKLQDTPIAITAVNAELLESRNQTSLASVAAQAPNVILTETGGAFGPGMSARIRGIGQGDYIAAMEPGVGIYIDDVYYPSLTGANFDLIDLERVEILRGPQGTLAGRNSEGGAIKLYSQSPKGDSTGSARLTYGSRSLFDVRAMADLPVIDNKLFFRISGVSRKQDGYVDRYDYGCQHPGNGVSNGSLQGDCWLGTEGGKSYSAGRASLRWLATDNLEINLGADMTLDNSEVAANVLLDTAPVAPTNIGTIPWGSQYVPSNPYTSYATFTNTRADGSRLFFAPVTKTKVWGSNLTADWRLADNLSLKSITAYREFDSRWVEDNDASPAELGLGAEHQLNHSFSQELRLNGEIGSAVSYAVGLYYFNQVTIGRTHQMLNYVPTPFLFEFLGNDPTDASSKAAFANGTWHITDDLNLNLGVRHTKEDKNYKYSRRNPDGTPNAILGALTGAVGAYEGSKTDYRINMDYRWSEQLMTYASVSTGFKGGGTNPRPFNVAQVKSFDPETLTAYEVGAKTDFFNRKLRANVSVFLNKYKDIQVTLLACPAAPCAQPANAGDADIKGAELEIEARPVDNLSIDASYSMLRFKYTRVDAATGVPVGSTAPGTIENKYSIGAQYEFLLSDGGSITPRVDYSFQGGFNTNAIPTAGNRVYGYHLTNAKITWKAHDSGWDASLIGSNLLDKTYFFTRFDLTGSGGGSNYGAIAPPREFSIQISKKF
jgi:iron complex outermembrane recepter protein